MSGATPNLAMMQEAMRYVNNRFDRDSRGVAYGSATGRFSASGGTMDARGVLAGQYYWIEGSRLNDGLHLHPADDLRDESFEGAVVQLVVPTSFADLCAEIAGWCESNAEAIGGPYQSESFGGYSYAMATVGAQGNETPAAAWQAHFGARLRPYRKLSRDWV